MRIQPRAISLLDALGLLLTRIDQSFLNALRIVTKARAPITSMLFQSFPSAAPSFPFRTYNNGDPTCTSQVRDDIWTSKSIPSIRDYRAKFIHRIAMSKVEPTQLDKRLVLIITWQHAAKYYARFTLQECSRDKLHSYKQYSEGTRVLVCHFRESHDHLIAFYPAIV